MKLLRMTAMTLAAGPLMAAPLAKPVVDFDDFYAPAPGLASGPDVFDHTTSTRVADYFTMEYEGAQTLALRIRPITKAELEKELADGKINPKMRHAARSFTATAEREAANRTVTIGPLDEPEDDLVSLSFKMKATATGAGAGLTVVVDGLVTLATAKGEDKAVKCSDGFKAYSARFSPRHGAVMHDIKIVPDSASAAGFEQEFVIIDFCFHRSGPKSRYAYGNVNKLGTRSASAGPDTVREKRWRDWQSSISRYKPDYSDSSKDLEPPMKGRLRTPLPLVVNGRPNAEIVYAPDRYGVVANAAKELQTWIRNISGADLPILTKEGAASVKILLNMPDGAKKFTREVEFLASGVGTDGYFVRTDGRRVYIGCAVPSTPAEEKTPGSGTRAVRPVPPDSCPAVPKGVLNGVYRFLENNFGLIFAWKDETIGTVYDKTNSLSVVWGDGASRPMTKYRQWGNDGMWGIRNGSNNEMKDEWGGAGHVRGELIEYLPDTPDYQTMVNGQRVKHGYYTGQACLSGPDAVGQAIRHAQGMRGEYSDRRMGFLGFDNEDNWLVCTCPKCIAPIRLPDGRVITSNGRAEAHKMDRAEAQFRSTQYWTFTDLLARGLHDKTPTCQLLPLAYFFMEEPPLVRISPYVTWKFAPYSLHDYNQPIFAPGKNVRLYDDYHRLLELGGRMHLYEYYGSDLEAWYGRYMPLAELMKADIAAYAQDGCELIFSEQGDGPNPLNIQEYWAYLRLCWDYDQDCEQLRKYFIRRVYHEGAPAVECVLGPHREAKLKGGRSSVKAMSDEESFYALGKLLPKIRNPIARANYVRLMNFYGKAATAMLVKSGRMTQAEADRKFIIPETAPMAAH